MHFPMVGSGVCEFVRGRIFPNFGNRMPVVLSFCGAGSTFSKKTVDFPSVPAIFFDLSVGDCSSVG